MPITRRIIGAPFTAVVFRANDPEFFEDDKKGKGMHLADMPFPGTSERFEKFKEQTERLKKRLMGSTLHDIEWVQITFVLPSHLEENLVPPGLDKK